MDLQKAYVELSNKIATVDFDKLWKGFPCTKFAIYTEREVCLNGKIFPKTDEFLGNTAIEYGGEHIAIWRLTDGYDVDVVASKIIHEMFHAYQHQFANLVWPNEMLSTFNYHYTVENLSIKQLENELLSEIVVKFDIAKFQKFCSLRKCRTKMFPFEMQYEMAVEQVEGSATFVELIALQQLSNQKYLDKFSGMVKNIIDSKLFFPIRSVCYDVGALLIKTIKDNNISCCFEFSSNSFLESLLARAQYCDCKFQSSKVSQFVDDYYSQTGQMIDLALEENNNLIIDNATLTGYNVYNARYVDGFLLTTFFVMYKDGLRDVVLHGDFVVEIDFDMKIKNLYKAKLSL